MLFQSTTATNFLLNSYLNGNSVNLYMGVEGSSSGRTDITATLDNASFFGSRTAHPVQFISNNSARMTIDSSGNVGIGTSPSTKFHILGAAQTSGGLRIQETTNNVYRTFYINTGGGLYFYNGTNEGYLSSGGAWTNASDARLKKNITDIKYGLSSVMEAKPRSFERVDVDGEYFGFVAQELQEVFPEAVSGDPERQLGVDYGSLVAVAFRAIQELKSENDSLKSRIEALEVA
jgi:hypothetical protein